MSNHTIPGDFPGEDLLDAIRALSVDGRRRLWQILSDEFGKASVETVPPSPTLREAQPEYIAAGGTPNAVPAPGRYVRISFQTPSRLADDLQAVAQERQTSIDAILNELLSTSLALLTMDHLPDEDIDSLAVRRELAAASIAALGDFWDSEVDLDWAEIQLCLRRSLATEPAGQVSP